jgi:hypothetical protein
MDDEETNKLIESLGRLVASDLDIYKASYANPVYVSWLKKWFSDPSPDKPLCCCYTPSH